MLNEKKERKKYDKPLYASAKDVLSAASDSFDTPYPVRLSFRDGRGGSAHMVYDWEELGRWASSPLTENSNAERIYLAGKGLGIDFRPRAAYKVGLNDMPEFEEGAELDPGQSADLYSRELERLQKERKKLEGIR